MLQLKSIVKTYVTGDISQNALKEVSIAFRESEFVSILGQSGSGKTTMLNIIGGLDRYSSGDLVINGVSTKQYNDSDWDYYRNHSIGFVFQSYNLIPHQSVLANVEMAMTLAGVSKKERREKAISVLKKVGLGDHIYKKPNQMSGGQMQRVAIARALVNNPDILLADEPTGALDSETSVQIMELLKEIAKDKLVIMVTHNPELAEKYSTRIVRLLDGKIVSDSNPFDGEEAAVQKTKHEKISMSFLTALSLSFNNLRTKKGRTLLTAFAGSIGIIGIALVIALSTGLNDYILSVQKDTMSSYPITIGSQSVDVTQAMGSRREMAGNMRNQAAEDTSNVSGIYADFQESRASGMLSSSLKENNLAAFKKYLDNPESEIRQYIGENNIVYSYDLSFSVFTHDKDGNLISSTSELEDNEDSFGLLGGEAGIGNRLKSITSIFGGSSSSEILNFSEIARSSDAGTVSQAIADSYDVLYGSWPKSYDEVVLVLNESNKLSADVLYQLGFLTKEEYEQNTEKAEDGEKASELSFDYSEVNGREFFLITASDRYTKNENGTFSLLDDSETDEKTLLKNAVKLKISGVVRPKSEAKNAVLSTAIAYTGALTDYIISHTDESEVVKAQEAHEKVNVLNGIEFEVPDDAKKVADAKEYIKNLDAKEKSSVYTLIKYYEAADKKSSAATDGAADTENMSESEKAAAFDEWVKSADDEVLLALFENFLSSGSDFGSAASGSDEQSATAESDKSGSSSGGNSIFEKLFGSVFKSGSSGNSVFGRMLKKIGGLFGLSSDSGSNFASSALGSLGDSAKLSLIREYIGKLSDSQKASLYTIIKSYNIDSADPDTLKSISSLLSAGQAGGISSGISLDASSVSALLDSWLENTPNDEILVKIYDEYIGDSTYESNMKAFGKVSYDAPSSIDIYADSFDSKDAVAACISSYNETVSDDLKITYTDYVSLITSSITKIIDNVSYAIIAFVAISLVVSCIMIGIITHISVMERTKEIGILRALGASKRNISQVFNAETFIVGCCAGLLGVGISLLATIPMNIIIEKFSGIEGLNARLPVSYSAVLVVLSVLITIIGGLLPAKKAAKKDPVIALRSE